MTSTWNTRGRKYSGVPHALIKIGGFLLSVLATLGVAAPKPVTEGVAAATKPVI